MIKNSVFKTHALEYDQWFVEHDAIYEAELKALKSLCPTGKKGLEIGVGTGRFAAPLNVSFGLEPSAPMAALARQRGVTVVEGVAENLPFEEGSFDFALMVTTICFVNDPLKSLREAWRILKSEGALILAFVDKDSPLGKKYQARQSQSVFYRDATFFSTPEIISLLKQAGFSVESIKQTLFSKGNILDTSLMEDGYGKGSFIAIRALKKIRY